MLKYCKAVPIANPDSVEAHSYFFVFERNFTDLRN